MMKFREPIVNDETAGKLMELVKSSKENEETLSRYGADLYSMGLCKGSLVTLAFAALPAAVYGLNRFFRRPG